MRFTYTIPITLFLIGGVAIQAQTKWKTMVFWDKLNIQLFAKEITYFPSYEEYSPDNKVKENIYIIGDTIAMYIYRNKINMDGEYRSYQGIMHPNRKPDSFLFLDSLMIKSELFGFPFYVFNQKLSIYFNDKIIVNNLDVDSFLNKPVGKKWNGIEVVQRGNDKMLFFVRPVKYQDELVIKQTDGETEKVRQYKFNHVDPFPKLVNYYNLNQKNIFDVIKNRDSIQLRINDSSFQTVKLIDHKNKGDGSIATFRQANGDTLIVRYKEQGQNTINLKSDENNILLLFQRFKNTDTLKLLYQFMDEENSDTTWHTAPDVFILQFTNLLPGKKYQLNVKYNLTPYAVSHYMFTVEVKWWQILWAKLLLAFAIGAAFIGTGWIIYRTKKQNQLQKEQEEKENLHIRLESVRSQLNPHFIFNALASVQGLINKNDVYGANMYLSQISTLMRQTLEYSQQPMITLADEIKIIKNYIEIEQLRFAFNYTIAINPAIEAEKTDVPAMLLQPVIENAIKHGLSGIKHGKLEIKIMVAAKNMYIIISDNGKGFNKDAVQKGHGLRLTKERINLFNKLYKDASIDFIIKGEINQGTTIIFNFKDWL